MSSRASDYGEEESTAMSLFLLKPHVLGPEGTITTPDVVVDRLFINGEPSPVGLLTHEISLQASLDETSLAAYGIMALGGGALILPAIVLGNGIVSASRQAWRLNNLVGHIGDVTLNGVPLADIGLPADEIRAVGGFDDALPRGFLLVRTVGGEVADAVLDDPRLGRTMVHRVTFEPLDYDRWGDVRPNPRYSIGPTRKRFHISSKSWRRSGRVS